MFSVDSTLTGNGTISSPLHVTNTGLTSVSTDSTLLGNGTVGSPLSVVNSNNGPRYIKIPVGTTNASSTISIPANAIVTSVATIINSPYLPLAVNTVAGAGAGGVLFSLDNSGNVYYISNYSTYYPNNLGNIFSNNPQFVGTALLKGNIPNAIDIGNNGNSDVGILDSSGNIYYSSDYGATFTATGNVLSGIKMGFSGGMHILDSLGTIHYSSNNGATFTTMGNVPNAVDIDSYYGVHVLDSSGNIYYSTDNGLTFTTKGNIPNGISIGTQNSPGTFVYVLDSLGTIHYSSDGGITFNTTGNVPGAVGIAPFNGGFVTIDNNGYIYRTNILPIGVLHISACLSTLPTLQVQVNGSTPLIIQSTNGSIPFQPFNFTNFPQEVVSSSNAGVVEVVVGNTPIAGSAL